MKITIMLNAQMKRAAGVDTLDIELDENARFNDLIEHIKSLSVKKLNDFMFNNQQLVRYLLFVLNLNKQIRAEENIILKDGDIISIISPISGG
jgi:molybdopterin converting factor small subunit